LRPTPYGKTLHFTARIITLTENKAEVEMDLFSEDNHCAKGKGLFVAVKKGHPAYHRW
jgi:acyl-CoA thioesterase FadM